MTEANKKLLTTKDILFFALIESELRKRIDRSAWNKAVTKDAINFLEGLMFEHREYLPCQPSEMTKQQFKEMLLNGASDWERYSSGGSSLIYDCDIAKHYCNSSEFKKTRGGERQPNSRESWIDVQARALKQACNRFLRAVECAKRELNNYEITQRLING